MSTLEKGYAERLGNQSLSAVADDSKRGILVALADASGSLSERAIATELAAGDGEADSEAVREVRTKLYHVHLPALEDAGLVSWDRADGTVETTDHPLFADRFADLLYRDGDAWDDVRSCVTDEDRRAVLDVLESHASPVTRSTVAREVAARQSSEEPSAEDVRDVEIRLHHVHLPKLDEAGLVDYDADAETVSHELADEFAVSDLLAGA